MAIHDVLFLSLGPGETHITLLGLEMKWMFGTPVLEDKGSKNNIYWK